MIIDGSRDTLYPLFDIGIEESLEAYGHFGIAKHFEVDQFFTLSAAGLALRTSTDKAATTSSPSEEIALLFILRPTRFEELRSVEIAVDDREAFALRLAGLA